MNFSKSDLVETELFNIERDVSPARDLTAFCLNLYTGTVTGESAPDRVEVYRDGEIVTDIDKTDGSRLPVDLFTGPDGEGMFRRRLAVSGSDDTRSVLAARLGQDSAGREISAVIKSENETDFGPLTDNRDHLILGEVKRTFAAVAASRTIQRALQDNSRMHFLVDEYAEIVWSYIPAGVKVSQEIIDRTRVAVADPRPENTRIAHFNLLNRPYRLVSTAPFDETPGFIIELDKLFIERMIHKLRGKLGAILTASEQFGDVNNKLSAEDRAQMLGIVDKAAEQIGFILNRFETFTTLPEPEHKNFDLATWLKNIVEVKATEESPIRLDVSQKVINVSTDKELLRQAVSELIDNALESSDRSQPPSVILDIDGTSVSITVSNELPTKSGDKIRLSRNITEPFLSTKSGKAGLGLTIVRAIMYRLGGQLEIDLNNNVRFTARLVLSHDDFGEN